MIMPATTDDILDMIQEFKKENERKMGAIEDRQNEDRKMLLSLVQDVKMQQLEDHKMIMDIWSSREKVTINFSRTFFLATSVISFVVSIMSSTGISFLFKAK